MRRAWARPPRGRRHLGVSTGLCAACVGLVPLPSPGAARVRPGCEPVRLVLALHRVGGLGVAGPGLPAPLLQPRERSRKVEGAR
jgi:hypothetical protein